MRHFSIYFAIINCREYNYVIQWNQSNNFGFIFKEYWYLAKLQAIQYPYLNIYVFVPIGLKFFMGAQETKYLSIGHEKSKLWCLFSNLYFWLTFSGKMGAAITRPNGLGPLKRIFRGEPPPLKNREGFESGPGHWWASWTLC